jgi:amidase
VVEPTELDAVGQAELVRRADVSPRELVEAAIGRIEAHDDALNAVVVRRFDRALEEAEAPAEGPFRGVPILLKDVGAELAGEVQTYGTRFLRDAAWRAHEDSHVGRRLREAGFVVLGRTNSPELATDVTTEPAAYGPCRNPYDLMRSAGGSSGGSAAAVAARMVAVAHGNDGGGSLRIPASACGLVALKPTRARISAGPLHGEQTWAGATVEGVLTRTVRDTAALLDVLAGPERSDPYHAPPLAGPLREEVGRDPGRLRVGVLERRPRVGGDPAPECAAAVSLTARLLERLGHEVEPDAPAALDDVKFDRHYAAMIAADVVVSMRRWEAELGRSIGDDELEPRNVAFRRIGTKLSAGDYLTSRQWLHRFSTRIASWWADDRYDLLLTPTVAGLPPEPGFFSAEGDVRLGGQRVRGWSPYTSVFNVTGQPAVSLPVHRTATGLPVGVQLVAAFGREDLLVRVAAQLEAEIGWASVVPAGLSATPAPPGGEVGRPPDAGLGRQAGPNGTTRPASP